MRTSDVIRDAIEAAEVERLRALVAADPPLAGALVATGEGGKDVFPALHPCCDVVFRGLATGAQALAMADVLLEAGVDPDQDYARSGDTFLIAAASLGAEEVGLRLVELGADVGRRGLFGSSALHWAALMGLERPTRALAAAGSGLELADARYDGTPLRWALHAWAEGDRREGIPRAVRALVERGARVPPEALAGLALEADAPLREALAGR